MTEDWFFETLPLRPAPYRGECLSGYLLRLADLNGYGIFWDLVGDLLPGWKAPQQINRLRWEYPLVDWERIPMRTGLPPAELSRLTVASWVEKFRTLPDLHRSIYMSPGLFLRGMVNPDLRVCPICLRSQPYIRLLWRLIPVIVCLEHGCLLQERCSGCGTSLTPVSQDHHHLHCAMCGADFRSLSVSMAPANLLNTQKRVQENLCFLLDPTTTLAKGNDLEDTGASHDAERVLGLKFRYLRYRAGISIKSMVQKVNMPQTTITSIEQGTPVALPHYLSYLEAMQLSWKEFAGLEVPDKFVQENQAPRHAHLRICPNPQCSNHRSPSGTSVNLLGDFPGQRIARFQCKVCGRRFTRSYDGELRTRPRCLPIRPGKQPEMSKPLKEIACLIEMGMRGESNRKIAHALGWGEKTVRIYWASLGLEEQVHQAQAKKRAEEKNERHVTLRAQIQTVLDPLLEQDRPITLRLVGQALGTNCDYLHSCPDQAKYVSEAIQRHNTRLRQQKDEDISTQIAQGIQILRSCDQIVKVAEIAAHAGVSYDQLRDHYPDLRVKVHEAIQEQRTRLKRMVLKSQIEQIDAAAARLAAQGGRLSYRTILQEAGLSRYADRSTPIREALMRWVSNFAPRD